MRASRGVNRALDFLRAHRRPVSLFVFGAVTVLSYASSIWVAAGLQWPDRLPTEAFLLTAAALVVARVGAACACGLAAHRWRYVGPSDIRRLALAVAVGTVAFFPILLLVDALLPVDLALATQSDVLVLEPLLTLLYAASLWIAYRTTYEIAKQSEAISLDSCRVLIVGAGEAGESLLRHLLFHPAGFRPVAFVDDDWSRQGTVIHGVKVMGGTEALEEIAERTRAEEILIAIPSAEPMELRKIVRRCQSTGLPFRVLPQVAAVLDGDISVNQLREVQIEDLLGRDPVSLELPELSRELSGRTVLITGAAGSIGSELSRQIAINGPDAIVLFDQSETGLFFLELELKDLAPSVDITSVVGDVVDPGAVENAFIDHRPDWVLHAAAYKHVPMMESNEREALRNNIIGTWRVADTAGRHGVQRFVLVSTDKAVRPANVMGATKRAAEIVILELQEVFPGTAFGAVRFGNVLGSAGSVVPVFKRLLEAGKPLTVTHEDVTRYFMTIPEASQLVLQASLLSDLRGRIAMLEMGEPVRIIDLARTLIRLSGGGRGEERIVITGLRPGEKLHEELVAPEERALPTRIEKVNLLEPDRPALQHDLLARIGRWDYLLAVWQVEPVMDELLGIIPELDGNRTVSSDSKATPLHRDASLSVDLGRGRSPWEGASLSSRRPHYPFGVPGYIDRRHPSNRPEDLTRVPRRRATDSPDSDGLRNASSR